MPTVGPKRTVYNFQSTIIADMTMFVRDMTMFVISFPHRISTWSKNNLNQTALITIFDAKCIDVARQFRHHDVFLVKTLFINSNSNFNNRLQTVLIAFCDSEKIRAIRSLPRRGSLLQEYPLPRRFHFRGSQSSRNC